jgi:hypothetical protein
MTVLILLLINLSSKIMNEQSAKKSVIRFMKCAPIDCRRRYMLI